MSTRTYLAISGTVFGGVALLHLLRVANGWIAAIGPWTVPMWISWVGLLVPAALSVWAFRLASREPV
jgi:hypothetical protein